MKSLLPNDVNALQLLLKQVQEQLSKAQQDNEKINQEKAHWQHKYESLLESFRLAKQRQYHYASESHLVQDDLFDEADAPIPETTQGADHDTIEIAAHQRRRGKRAPIPAHFPREIIVHDIDEADKICACGDQKTKIGEAISEQFDVVPPTLKVIQHVRPKYSCRRCQVGVSMAPMPPLLLPKCMASAGFMAYTITSKYMDQLPLYRQEQIWRRYDLDVPRNSLCRWLMQTAERCEPLYRLLAGHVLSGRSIQADESPVQVLKEPNRTDRQKSYMWIYRGGPPDKIAVYFAYEPTRSGAHAKEFLKEFKGYLQSDGYCGYDWIDDTADITHLACWVHARRPFAELVKLSKKTGQSHEVLALIEQLYQVEAEARDMNAAQRYEYRQAQATSVLETIKIWLEKNIQGAPPKGKFGKGIHYMLRRWDQLNHYLLDGDLHIDNNRIENDIRVFALGKKNWLFKGSPRGAKAGAIFFSLIKTAQANQLEPYAYLRYMLTQLPLCKTQADYSALLPWNLTADKIAYTA